MDLLKIISYVPAIVGVLSVGVFVFLNSQTNIKNRLFAIMNLLIASWLVFLFLADITSNTATALWALRFSLFFGQFIFLLFLLFTFEFPTKIKIKPVILILISLPIFLLAVSLLTPLGVGSVTIQDFGVRPEEIGFLYAASDLVGIGYLLAGGGVLLYRRQGAKPQHKSQISLVLVALLIVLGANTFTGLIVTLFHGDPNLIWVGSFSIFIFSLLVTYAIIRHRFFDIRPIVARSFAYLLLLLSLGVLFAAIVFTTTNIFFSQDTTPAPARLLYLIAALAMAFAFQPLRRFFDRISNKLFYQDAYDPQEFLDRLNAALVADLSAASIISKSTEIIGETLKPSFVGFYLVETPHIPERFTDDGLHPSLQRHIPSLQDMTAGFNRKVILADEIADHRDTQRLYDIMRKNDVGALIRLINAFDHRTDEVGYIFIGYKKSGNLYSSQDVRVLEIIANELVIAIQNALRFQEIENFNATLQEKIEDATRRLRQSNAKLKMLDQTKDDFISMASHQLRTPLTSVKGYVSMVLDGDAGKITPLQRKLLNQSFVSSQRMVYLISDLLNVSRLRTGKFIIEPLRTNLASVIQGEIEQLVETAKSRNLELVYSKPEHFPVYMLDETKLRQVIMNFVDNAIYYTPSGGRIAVNLVEKPQTIEFTVVDTGMGVPKHDQPHLFTKFFRAGNAKRARPDGTGLGLFMAKKVVIAQGGAIIFKSQEGKGSTFGFSFAKDKLQLVP